MVIALLLVRRNRVMDLRFYAVVSEILLQLVAMFREDGEDMPDTIPIRLRYMDQRILHLIKI